jgi:hypothetical protein
MRNHFGHTLSSSLFCSLHITLTINQHKRKPKVKGKPSNVHHITIWQMAMNDQREARQMDKRERRQEMR